MALGVCTFLFALLQLAPGDAADYFFNPDMPPEAYALMRKNLGLDQGGLVQYARWLRAAMTLDFGISMTSFRPVSSVIGERVAATLVLSVVSTILLFATGIVLGIVSGVRPYSVLDNVLTSLSLFFYSMPAFWLALMSILVFSVWLGWLPISGMGSLRAASQSGWPWLVDRIGHLVLPSFALGIAYAAGVARYMRGSLLEVMGQDYIRTARAKGLSWRVVVSKHALRNAMIPVITLLGLSMPFLFSGAVLVESVFAWPGMGQLIVESVFKRDTTVVMATTFMLTILTILGNLLADVLYAVADPRIRYA
jgi:peptide/nickel transport system permease protein